jgi:hypothetical protein
MSRRPPTVPGARVRLLLAALLLAGPAAGTLALTLPAAPASAAPAPPAGPTGPDGMQCAPAADTVFRPVPWAQRRLDPQRVWMLTRGGSITVAVLDTGVSRTAPALAGRVLPGRDVRTGGPADTDCAGHGTFLAGLIAARPVGTARFTGAAPDTRILPIRVSDRAEDVHPDLLAKGIETAVQGGATVIAVVATAPFGSTALQHAVALANRHDAVVIASPVSIRGQQGDVAYPAALPGVMSVMAIGPDGKPPGVRPANRPTLAAPGADLISIAPTGRGNVQGSGVNLGVGYVAAAAALVRAYLPHLTAAAVRDRLTATTDPVADRPDPLLGNGIVNPVAAVTAVLPAATEHRPDPPTPQPVVLPPTQVVDRRPAHAALAWGGAALLAGIGVVAVGPILIQGRRRRWSTSPAASEPPNQG